LASAERHEVVFHVRRAVERIAVPKHGFKDGVADGGSVPRCHRIAHFNT